MITEKWKENKYRNKISNLKELLYVYNSISSNKDEVKLLKSLIKYAEITFNLYIIRKFKNNQNLNNTLLNLESFDIFENFDKYNDNDNIYGINQSLNHFPIILWNNLFFPRSSILTLPCIFSFGSIIRIT